jgi:hypothetical protein
LHRHLVKRKGLSTDGQVMSGVCSQAASSAGQVFIYMASSGVQELPQGGLLRRARVDKLTSKVGQEFAQTPRQENKSLSTDGLVIRRRVCEQAASTRGQEFVNRRPPQQDMYLYPGLRNRKI